MTVIHIPITQLNVTLIGLGYYMTLNFPYTHHEVDTTLPMNERLQQVHR
jgi:hypothetical protein